MLENINDHPEIIYAVCKMYPKKIKEWQPGDIVVFGDDHIGIISDRRNSEGITYVIHNGGQKNREEDYLTKSEITGHYRFDSSKIPSGIIKTPIL